MNQLKKQLTKKSILILLGITFVGFFILNYFMPYTMDEYTNSFILTTEKRLKTIGDLLESGYIYYMRWGGRTQAFVQIFLMLPKMFYNFFNSIVFILLIIGIYININGRLKIRNVFTVFIMIITFIWFGTPDFGQSSVWISGSINYLWWTVLLLFFTYYLKKLTGINYDKNPEGVSAIAKIHPAWLMVFGFASGWTNENMSLAIIGTTGLYLLFIYRRKFSAFEWKILGTFLLWSAVMMLAIWSLNWRYENWKIISIICLAILIFSAILVALILEDKLLHEKSVIEISNGNKLSARWAILFSGFVVGMVFLLFAPGNFARSKITTDTYKQINFKPTFWGSLKIILVDTKLVWVVLGLIILFFIFLIIKKQYKNFGISSVYYYELIIGVVALLAMWGSPFFPARAGYGAVVYIIVFIINIVLEIIEKFQIHKKIMVAINIVSLATVIISFGFAFGAYKVFWEQGIERAQILTDPNRKFEELTILPNMRQENKHLSIKEGLLVAQISKSLELFYQKKKVLIVDRISYENLIARDYLSNAFYTFAENNPEPRPRIKGIYISKERNEEDKFTILVRGGYWDKDERILLEDIDIYPIESETKKLKNNAKSFKYTLRGNSLFVRGDMFFIDVIHNKEFSDFEKIEVNMSVSKVDLNNPNNILSSEKRRITFYKVK